MKQIFNRGKYYVYKKTILREFKFKRHYNIEFVNHETQVN